MERKFIKHCVTDMDESMVQHCVICGEIISDYRNAMYPSGQEPPKGFDAGNVYVSVGNPTIYLSEEVKPQEHEFEVCSF